MVQEYSCTCSCALDNYILSFDSDKEGNDPIHGRPPDAIHIFKMAFIIQHQSYMEPASAVPIKDTFTLYLSLIKFVTNNIYINNVTGDSVMQMCT